MLGALSRAGISSPAGWDPSDFQEIEEILHRETKKQDPSLRYLRLKIFGANEWLIWPEKKLLFLLTAIVLFSTLAPIWGRFKKAVF